MVTFFSEGSRQRQARSELHDGALVTPFECPERMDLVLAALSKAAFEVRSPSHGICTCLSVGAVPM